MQVIFCQHTNVIKTNPVQESNTYDSWASALLAIVVRSFLLVNETNFALPVLLELNASIMCFRFCSMLFMNGVDIAGMHPAQIAA
jgi:hypothetical protein